MRIFCALLAVLSSGVLLSAQEDGWSPFYGEDSPEIVSNVTAFLRKTSRLSGSSDIRILPRCDDAAPVVAEQRTLIDGKKLSWLRILKKIRARGPFYRFG